MIALSFAPDHPSGASRARPLRRQEGPGMIPGVAFLLAAALGAPGPTAAAVAPAPGATVPALTLKDIHRRPRPLDGFKDRKAFVVVFIGTECPLANLYLPTLAALHKEYAGRGVQFLAINSNSQDTFIEVSAHAQEHA